MNCPYCEFASNNLKEATYHMENSHGFKIGMTSEEYRQKFESLGYYWGPNVIVEENDGVDPDFA